jgi:2-isopropylmalate synthase
MAAEVKIYDTTLRDGCHGAGISLSLGDKLAIARRLDEFGLDYVEGGWPGSNPKDAEFFRRPARGAAEPCPAERIRQHEKARYPGAAGRQPSSAARGRNARRGPRGQGLDFHVDVVLRTTPEENLAMVADSVAYLKAHGREVVLDAEHFSTARAGSTSTPSRPTRARTSTSTRRSSATSGASSSAS